MPIRYSSVVGGSGGSGFNLDIGSSGNTTFVFSEVQAAGGYSITSQLTDATIEFYAIAEDGSLAGYTNTKALTASKDFNKMVIYGASNNDLITFEFKPTTLPSGSGDQDSGAAPFITSVSDVDLANIDDTTIITGGNFATDVVVTFTGTDNVVRNAKSVVRTNSTQLIVTRPDAFLEDNAPYTLEVSNPGIPQSVYATNTSSITAGGDPIWITPAGELSPGAPLVAYSFTLDVSEPDNSNITYSLSSGVLPDGLSLDSATGIISGTPITLDQVEFFTITATDSEGNATARSFSISIAPAFGGTVTDASGYRYHTFTSNGTLTVAAATSVEALIIAGGGAGGLMNGSAVGGGGGGAGGYIAIGSQSLGIQDYLITVGGGGTGVADTGGNGGPSEAFGQIAIGGGGGGGISNSSNGNNGGSGGGGGASSGQNGLNTPGQGSLGGDGALVSDQYKGGGGGGATQPGVDAASAGNGIGAAGGNGLSAYSDWGLATSTGHDVSGVRWYAGGGGGSSVWSGWAAAITNGAGGNGGGGEGSGITGGQDSQRVGSAGMQNTGGGGGASPYGGSAGYDGGSGIVIIRYPI